MYILLTNRQGRRNIGRAEGAAKMLRAMETHKKTKKSLPIMLATVKQEC